MDVVVLMVAVAAALVDRIVGVTTAATAAAVARTAVAVAVLDLEATALLVIQAVTPVMVQGEQFVLFGVSVALVEPHRSHQQT